MRQIHHDAIARDLGHDRCGGNRKGSCVAFDDGRCRNGQVAGQAIAVDQYVIWAPGQGIYGAAHGQVAGLKYVDFVDLFDAGHADRSLGTF